MKKARGLALAGEERPSGRATIENKTNEIKKMQELWLLLAKHEWSSVVLMPGDAEGSTADLARTLAEVGKNLSDGPVSAVTVRVLGPGSARALASLAHHLRGGRKRLQGARTIEVAPLRSEEPEDDDDPLVPATGQVILGVPSVVSEPLALAVAQAADLVVLSIELGKTRLRDVRRSIDLIGRERIVGCILV